MAYLKLYDDSTPKNGINIMIFTEGTIIGPKNIFQHFNHTKYKPIKNAVNVIKGWAEQGSEINYFTSRKKISEVRSIKEILLKYNFVGERLYYRSKKQKYKDIIEAVVPNILIEDDCRSIGGKWQMCITYVNSETKKNIKSIVVKEFMGIDDLSIISTEFNYI